MARKNLVLPPIEPAVEPLAVLRSRAESRVRLVSSLLVLCLLAVAARGATLCLFPSERTLRSAAVQRWDQVTLRARRGEVVDRNGRRLATSVATPNIVVDPLRVGDDERVGLAARLAELLQRPQDEILEKLGRDSQYQRLAMQVHPKVAAEIEALDHPALWVEREPRRYYPEETLASQVLGFVDAAGSGREGLEASLDQWLRGGSVLLQRRRDRHGMNVDDPTGNQELAAGLDVTLTLDRTIQRIAERSLADVMEKSAPDAAWAVVIDVATGDVLAMANAPSFNPNVLSEEAAPRKNHVLQDAIEPGSVFKPFTVAVAVEEGLVHHDSKIDCEGGGYNIGRAHIKDDHPHGVITIRELLKYSSNIGSAKLALKIGGEKFLGYFRRFGFGQRTGIQLPGERTGVLRKPEHIKPIELATTAYGQGVTATPLQLAMAVAALGNDGVRMTPRIVSRIEDQHGVPEFVRPPTIAERVVSVETAREVVEMMVSVTEPGGTATRAAIPGYRVAGKTGTAQKAENGRYGDGRIGSFVGLVPADDPVLAIVVSVDDPSVGSRYGGIVAAPAFAEIAAASLRHLGIAPDPELLALASKPATRPAADAAPAPATSQPVIPATPLVLAWTGEAWTLPDLTGRSLRDLSAAIGPAGLALRADGSGVVADQSPAPGTPVAPGAEVHVTLR
jgi:cell division protein FtsI (penicillin-binding protein 3)